MNALQFSVTVEFDDGDKFELGSGDEVYGTPGEEKQTVLLNDERQALIKRLQDASEEN